MEKNDRLRVINHLLKPLARVFPAVPQESVGDYLDALSGYSNQALQEAFRLVRNERKYPTTPTIAEMKDACERGCMRTANTERRSPVERQETFKETEQRAFKQPMGKRALEEGWPRSYLVRFLEHGAKAVFTEDYIADQKKAQMDMKEFIEKNKELCGVTAALVKSLRTLQQVDRDLQETYLDR